MKKYLRFLFVFLILSYGFSASSSEFTSFSNASIPLKNTTLVLNPINKTVFIPPNGAITDFFEVISNLPGNLGFNFSVNFTSSNSSWINLTDTFSSNQEILAGETCKVNMTISIPPFTSSQIYYANFTINSSNYEIEFMNLTINVTDNVGTINVTVKDSLGTYLPSSSVFIWGSDFLLKDTGLTNEDGVYPSDYLAPGEYLVEAIRAGYSLNSGSMNVSGNLNVSNITIILEPNGAPILSVSPTSISESTTTGLTVSRTLIITNDGDIPLVNISFDSSSSWIAFNNSLISTLFPNENELVKVTLGSLSSSGTYQGKIEIVSVNGGSQNITTVLDVSSSGDTSDDSGDSGTSDTSSGGFAPIVSTFSAILNPERKLEIISCPLLVNAIRGKNPQISIEVNNSGDYDFSDVSLAIVGPFPFEIHPKESVIKVGDSQKFLVRVNISNQVKLGIYNFLVTASGEGASDSTNFKLQVKSFENETELEILNKSIEYIDELIKELENEVETLKIRSGIKDPLNDLINEALNELIIAKQNLELGNYGNVENSLDEAITSVYSLIENISDIRRIQFNVSLVFNGVVTALFSVAALMAVWTLFKRKYKTKENTPKKEIGNLLSKGFNDFRINGENKEVLNEEKFEDNKINNEASKEDAFKLEVVEEKKFEDDTNDTEYIDDEEFD